MTSDHTISFLIIHIRYIIKQNHIYVCISFIQFSEKFGKSYFKTNSNSKYNPIYLKYSITIPFCEIIIIPSP